MTNIELLALVRAVICVVVLPFPFRARMWFLTAAWMIALVVQLSVTAGMSRQWAGLLAIPFYGALAAHTLDVGRTRRSGAYLPHRKP